MKIAIFAHNLAVSINELHNYELVVFIVEATTAFMTLDSITQYEKVVARMRLNHEEGRGPFGIFTFTKNANEKNDKHNMIRAVATAKLQAASWRIYNAAATIPLIGIEYFVTIDTIEESTAILERFERILPILQYRIKYKYFASLYIQFFNKPIPYELVRRAYEDCAKYGEAPQIVAPPVALSEGIQLGLINYSLDKNYLNGLPISLRFPIEIIASLGEVRVPYSDREITFKFPPVKLGKAHLRYLKGCNFIVLRGDASNVHKISRRAPFKINIDTLYRDPIWRLYAAMCKNPTSYKFLTRQPYVDQLNKKYGRKFVNWLASQQGY